MKKILSLVLALVMKINDRKEVIKAVDFGDEVDTLMITKKS